MCMKKVLTISDLGVMICATEELISMFKEDLKKEEDSFKRKYLEELEDTHERVNHIINHMNEEEEDSNLLELDVEEDDKYCLYVIE